MPPEASAREKLALACFFAVCVAVYSRLTTAYEIGTLSRPGPGFWPILLSGIGLLLTIANVVVVALEWRTRKGGSRPEASGEPGAAGAGAGRTGVWPQVRVLVFVLVCVAYVVLLRHLGYLLASMILVVATLASLGVRPLRIGLIGLGFPYALWMALRQLKVVLPSGPWGF